MKPCTKCGESKPLSDFYRHSKSRDGYTWSCRQCLRSHKPDYIVIERKICKACLIEKDKAEFYIEKRSKDGYQSKCKACKSSEKKARYQLNKEQYADYQRQYHKVNQKKVYAHRAVSLAVARGDLIKADACESCGSLGPVQGHHDDYDQPLSVRWLCASCHCQWHAKHGEAANAA